MRLVLVTFFRSVVRFRCRLLGCWSGLVICGLVGVGGFAAAALAPAITAIPSTGIVISQVYGGGGNSMAPFTHDFIEIFNRGNVGVNVSGWSVQYASATGTSWSQTNLPNVTIPPGGYLLIQEASGGANGVALPMADATGTIGMAAGGGKVALVNDTMALSGGCPVSASIVDLVGYGATATCSETAPTATPGNTTAALRQMNGCTETDNNSTDFATGAPNPRNSASPVNFCNAPTNPTGTGAAAPNPVTPGGTALLTVTVTPGTNPASTGLSVTGDLTAIGGVAAQPFFDNGTNGDVTAGDNIFSYLATVSGSTTTGGKTLNISIADAQSRAGSTTISLMVQPPIVPGSVVISQVYAAGGNSLATYTNDFVELFNRSLTPVTMTNWSVQYISGSGTGTWDIIGPLNFTLQPGQYFLLQGSSGASGSSLPVPDFDSVTNPPTLSMSATAGKVALVSNTTALSGACPVSSSILDLVGYGSAATCFEPIGGIGAPASVSSNNANAVLRQANGCTDTDNNASDFAIGAVNPRNSATPLFSCFTAPNVTAHPTDQWVAPGAIVTFTAAAAGTEPITVQWQVSTDGSATWSNISGATTTTLTVPNVVLADNGKLFRAVFTNALGMANSNAAILTVLPATAKIMDPLVCIGDGSTLNVRAEIRNTSNVVVEGVFRAQLGTGLVTRNSSCVITGNGSCSFSGDTRVGWSELLQPGEGVVIEYQVQVTPGVTTGMALCITSTFEFNAGTVASVEACTKVNCPIVGGGGDLPSGVVANNSRPGSVLFFPYYASDLTRPQQENTRFTFTNTEGARGVTLHLFFVSADDCRVADTFLCLTAGQTTSLLASEYDPGERGFLVAVAVDGRTGCPINFNYLIGSEYVKLLSGHATNLSAFSIAAMTGGPAACDPGETTASLRFNGTDYTLVPRILAVNNIQSPLDDNNTLLILNRIGGNYSTGTATRLADLWGFVYDDAEVGHSFQFDPTGCQYVRRIFDGAPRISPPITKVIPRGRTGWMRIQPLADSALFGAVINLSPTGFSHGHNLHALAYTDASITIPIIPPPCGR